MPSTLTTHSLYTHYTLTTHPLCTHYALTTHSLHTHYTPTLQVYDAMPDDVEAAIIDQLDPAPHALMSWKHLQGVLQELGVEEYVGDGAHQVPVLTIHSMCTHYALTMHSLYTDGAHQVPVPACSRASPEDKAQVQADSKRFLAFVLDLEGCLHIDRCLHIDSLHIGACILISCILIGR
jgi:hypothetical protein